MTMPPLLFAIITLLIVLPLAVCFMPLFDALAWSFMLYLVSCAAVVAFKEYKK